MATYEIVFTDGAEFKYPNVDDASVDEHGRRLFLWKRYPHRPELIVAIVLSNVKYYRIVER